MRKRIDIEKLLKWAYCEELPKGGGGDASRRAFSAWVSVESFVQLLTKIDFNEYGVLPSLSPIDGEPHEDSLKVHEAVCSLDLLEVDFPTNWNPMPEIAAFPECDQVLNHARFGIANRKKTAAQLVQRHAILGGCPVWEGQMSVREVMRNGNGAPIWFQMQSFQSVDADGIPLEYKNETENGWNRNTNAPKAGAYQKFDLKPDPTGLIIARGEYQIWWSSLGELVKQLAKKLTSWTLLPTTRPACPWEGGGWRVPRVVSNLTINT